MSQRHSLVMLVLLTFAASACSTTETNLSYTPKQGIPLTANPTVSAVNATDRRKESPSRLATIMGGFGNPLKYLDTKQTVREEVTSAFIDGLKARGLYSDAGIYRIELAIWKLDADMIMGRTARIDMDLVVVSKDGRAIYKDAVNEEKSDFKFFATGVFADIMDLKRMVQSLLDAAIDRMLDKPEFRTAIAGRGARIS